MLPNAEIASLSQRLVPLGTALMRFDDAQLVAMTVVSFLFSSVWSPRLAPPGGSKIDQLPAISHDLSAINKDFLTTNFQL